MLPCKNRIKTGCLAAWYSTGTRRVLKKSSIERLRYLQLRTFFARTRCRSTCRCSCPPARRRNFDMRGALSVSFGAPLCVPGQYSSDNNHQAPQQQRDHQQQPRRCGRSTGSRCGRAGPRYNRTSKRGVCERCAEHTRGQERTSARRRVHVRNTTHLMSPAKIELRRLRLYSFFRTERTESVKSL
jgi:hypothetical protein